VLNAASGPVGSVDWEQFGLSRTIEQDLGIDLPKPDRFFLKEALKYDSLLVLCNVQVEKLTVAMCKEKSGCCYANSEEAAKNCRIK